MLAAAERAASRRGSSIRMVPSPRQGAGSSAGGTAVVLPAPGGARSTTGRLRASASAMAGSTGRMGRSVMCLMWGREAGRPAAGQ
jgi:hypothetical protein